MVALAEDDGQKGRRAAEADTKRVRVRVGVPISSI